MGSTSSSDSLGDVRQVFLQWAKDLNLEEQYSEPYFGNETKLRAFRRMLTGDYMDFSSDSDYLPAQRMRIVELDTVDATWEAIQNEEVSSLTLDVRVNTYNRRFSMTKKGYVGLRSSQAAIDDRICILSGATVPFLLRPAVKRLLRHGKHRLERIYTYVGDCYVQGIMDGEAVDLPGSEWEDIVIAGRNVFMMERTTNRFRLLSPVQATIG